MLSVNRDPGEATPMMKLFAQQQPRLRRVLLYLIGEGVLTLWLAHYLFNAFRGEAKPVTGLAASTGISVVLFSIFYMLDSRCGLSQLWNYGSVLYGAERDTCFSPRGRLALSFVLALMYACPIALAVTLIAPRPRRYQPSSFVRRSWRVTIKRTTDNVD
jgi:hypothetical protein